MHFRPYSEFVGIAKIIDIILEDAWDPKGTSAYLHMEVDQFCLLSYGNYGVQTLFKEETKKANPCTHNTLYTILNQWEGIGLPILVMHRRGEGGETILKYRGGPFQISLHMKHSCICDLLQCLKGAPFIISDVQIVSYYRHISWKIH